MLRVADVGLESASYCCCAGVDARDVNNEIPSSRTLERLGNDEQKRMIFLKVTTGFFIWSSKYRRKQSKNSILAAEVD